MEKEKKLYYVKREVMAKSIVEAAKVRGNIYEISLAGPNDQPQKEKQSRVGFKKK